MEGDDSQKLPPWRGTSLLSGAQQTSGSLQNHTLTQRLTAAAMAGHSATLPSIGTEADPKEGNQGAGSTLAFVLASFALRVPGFEEV